MAASDRNLDGADRFKGRYLTDVTVKAASNAGAYLAVALKPTPGLVGTEQALAGTVLNRKQARLLADRLLELTT